MAKVDTRNLRGQDIDTYYAYNAPAFELGRLIGLAGSNAMQKDWDKRAEEKALIQKQAQDQGWAGQVGENADTLKEWQQAQANYAPQLTVEDYERAIKGVSDDKASPIISASGNSTLNTGSYGDLLRAKQSGQYVVDAINDNSTIGEEAIKRSMNYNGDVNAPVGNWLNSPYRENNINENNISGNYIAKALEQLKKDKLSDVEMVDNTQTGSIAIGNTTPNESVQGNYVERAIAEPSQNSIEIGNTNTPMVKTVGDKYVISAMNEDNPTEVIADNMGNAIKAPSGTANAQEEIRKQQMLVRAINDTASQGDNNAVAIASGKVEATPQEKTQAKEAVKDTVVARSQEANARKQAQEQIANPTQRFSALKYLNDMDSYMAQHGVQADIREKMLKKWQPEAIQAETEQSIQRLNRAWSAGTAGNQEYMAEVSRLAQINPTVAQQYAKGIVDRKDEILRENQVADKRQAVIDSIRAKQAEFIMKQKDRIFTEDVKRNYALLSSQDKIRETERIAQRYGLSKDWVVAQLSSGTKGKSNGSNLYSNISGESYTPSKEQVASAKSIVASFNKNATDKTNIPQNVKDAQTILDQSAKTGVWSNNYQTFVNGVTDMLSEKGALETVKWLQNAPINESFKRNIIPSMIKEYHLEEATGGQNNNEVDYPSAMRIWTKALEENRANNSPKNRAEMVTDLRAKFGDMADKILQDSGNLDKYFWNLDDGDRFSDEYDGTGSRPVITKDGRRYNLAR